MIYCFWQLVLHDIRLHLRQPFGIAAMIIFYMMVILLAPLGFGSAPALLSQVSGGLIWISFLLAALLQVEKRFAYERDNQILDILSLHASDLTIVLARSLSGWFLTLLPLILITPLAALMLHLPSESLLPLILSLSVGSISLSLIMTLGSALALSAGINSLLVSISLLPLCIPVLIFGITVIHPASMGLGERNTGLVILFALDLLALAGLPAATVAVLRVDREES